jgi:hypothetical protein
MLAYVYDPGVTAVFVIEIVPVVVIGLGVAVIPVPAATLVTVPVPAGKSAATRARNVGAAGPPEVGPANTVFAVCVFNANVKAGVVVGVATDVVNNGLRFPEEKDVTVPPEVAGVAAVNSPVAALYEFKNSPATTGNETGNCDFNANAESRTPESSTFPAPSVVTTSLAGAAAKFAAAVAAVSVLPDPATLIVPAVVIGPPVAIPAVPTEVTVPEPPVIAVADTLLPVTLNVTVALLTKFTLGMTVPFMRTEEPAPTAASMSTKFSATIGSIPIKDKNRFGVIGSELCT